MRSFAALSIAGLVAVAAAAPLNDGKYDDKHHDVSKYDDHKYEAPKYEAPKVEAPKYDDKKVEAPKYDDKKEDVKVVVEAPKHDDKKEEVKYDDGKKDDHKAEEVKYEDKKEEVHYDDKKGDDKKDDGKKEDVKYDDKKGDDKKDDGKKEDVKYDDKKVDDGKKEDQKYDDVDYGKDYSLNAFPFDFTSTYHAIAKPDQVVNANDVPVAGEKGACGYYNFGINSKEEVICFNITLEGVTGEYESPANTATHIHEAPKGKSGPPRLAFPNPQGKDYKRTSFGCLQGPFKTGITDDFGKDTADGFSLAQIEANPHGFFADVHTKKFLAGAVRGQLERKDKH